MTNANLNQIPVIVETETFTLATMPQPPKVLTFPVLCDSFLGMCSDCGTPTYASDAPRIVDGEISCPECVNAELSWKQVPAATRRAA